MLMLGDPISPGSNNFDLDWEARVRGNMRGEAPVSASSAVDGIVGTSHNEVAHVYEGPLGPDYVHEAAGPVENFPGGDFGPYAGPQGPGELYGDGPTAGSGDAHFNFSSLMVS